MFVEISQAKVSVKWIQLICQSSVKHWDFSTNLLCFACFFLPVHSWWGHFLVYNDFLFKYIYIYLKRYISVELESNAVIVVWMRCFFWFKTANNSCVMNCSKVDFQQCSTVLGHIFCFYFKPAWKFLLRCVFINFNLQRALFWLKEKSGELPKQKDTHLLAKPCSGCSSCVTNLNRVCGCVDNLST